MTGTHRILCVDDDPFYGDLYRQILEQKGYEVDVALDPAEGWKKATHRTPSLIVLDVMMPEKGGFKDGFSLLEEIRKNETLKAVPVLMVSALGNEDDVQHGIEAGATEYLPKQDIMPQTLVEAIERHLR